MNITIPGHHKFLFFSMATSLVALTTINLFFKSFWETNDDIAMSMIVHGYGIAKYSSPDLVFSNVIWGHLIQLIPDFNFAQGYSIATLTVLLASGWLIIYALLRNGFNFILTISIFFLIFIRPILFPQFTINAGLLMVSAILCWQIKSENKHYKISFLTGLIFAYFSYLVRSQEFLLLFLLAIPVLPWEKIRVDRFIQIASVVFILVVACSEYIDHRAYQEVEWQKFNVLNKARIPYTDYGADTLLKNQPKIMHKYGYSENDINLIRYWFFVDGNIADPKKLNAMLGDAEKSSGYQNYSLEGGIAGLKALLIPKLLIMTLPALILLLLRPSARLGIIWLLFIAAIFMLGLLGRPGVIRVYIPAVSFLVLISVLTRYTDLKSKSLKFIFTGLFVFVAIYGVFLAGTESKKMEIQSTYSKSEFKTLPSNAVVWGNSIPYTEIYPVFSDSQHPSTLPIYSLGVFALAPFSITTELENNQQGFLVKLSQEQGIIVAANEKFIALLGTYCDERLHEKLTTIEVIKSPKLSDAGIARYRCEQS